MEEDFLKRIWEQHKDKANFTFLELQNLYNFFLKKAKELGLDSQTFDFEHEIDYSLSYNENKALIEQKLINIAYPNAEPEEITELEHYKKELEKLRNKKEIKVIEKLERKMGLWQEKFKEFEQKLNKKEDIERIEQKINDFISFLSQNIELNPNPDNPLMKELKDRENRIIANILIQTKKERLSNECPRCFKKGRIVKGLVVQKIPFKQSLAFIFECPECGFRWGAQAFIGEYEEDKRKEEFESSQ
jgi:phosphatidate phosphatase PAH1